MNFIAVIIFITIVIEFILGIFTDFLNLKTAHTKLPSEFEGVYDATTYKKSQEYLKVNTKFGWITSLFDLCIILCFWFGRGFYFLDNWVRSFEQGPIITGLIYIGVLMLAKTLLSLPFSIYSTFVIEERFGFNKTTISTFVIDIIKGLILSIIIGGVVLAGILWFFEYAGNNAWWYSWIAVTVFMLGLQFIAPTWIMPLFNKFQPLDEGDLKEAIMAYAKSINFSLQNIFVMDGSKRSSKSNAFFTGFGKNKRIVLFDTLIEKHTEKELVGVLAHEMGHYKKKHILQMIIIGIIQTGIMFYLLSFFISYQGLFDAFYMDNQSVYAGFLFFGMLYSPISFFISILMNMFSRKNEYEADKFAVETTNDPNSFIDALKKLSVANLSNLTPHFIYVFFNYSHPPVLERIRNIMKMR